MMNVVDDPSSVVFGLAVGYAAGRWLKAGIEIGRKSWRKYREAREIERHGTNGHAAA